MATLKYGLAALSALGSLISLGFGLSGEGPGPTWVWILVAYATLAIAGFIAWSTEHQARLGSEDYQLSPTEKQLLRRLYKIHSDLLELMRKWPTSGCVMNPFSKAWRPEVGTTDIPADQQATMNWHKEAFLFILDAQKIAACFPEINDTTPYPKFTIENPPIEAPICLLRFVELEEKLTSKALQPMPPSPSSVSRR